MKLHLLTYLGLACCLALGAAVVLPGAADPTYRAAIEKWRQAYEAALKSDDGWLTVSGLFWLHAGDNRFGADPLNDIVLPTANMPPDAGIFSVRDGKTVVHVNPGVPITMNGKRVDVAELHADSAGERLHMGDLTLYLHASGARYGIRVKDKNSKLRRDFSGLHWFPIDESYRVRAQYVPYRPAKSVEVQNVLGDFDKTEIVGYVLFSLQDKQYRLDAEQDEPGTLSFVFRDLTSGKETYPAARFLDIDLAKDLAKDRAPNRDASKSGAQRPDAHAPDAQNGSVSLILDFNKAYNPPCAYNPYTTCPLPTPGNRLRVAIPAGEKIYKVNHGE